MTPKEKAEELVDKYRPLCESWDYVDFGLELERNWTKQLWAAKQCSLIAVDEMLEVAYYDGDPTIVDYLKEVKEEIYEL